MNCKEAIDIAEEAMDKDLPRAVKRRLDLHLSRCESCRRLFDAERAEHVRWFRIFNDPAAMRSLPPDFADRLVASVLAKGTAHTPLSRRFRLPRWLKRAACFALLLSGAAFAATVVVDAVAAKDGDIEGIEGTQETEGTGGSAALAASAEVATVTEDPYVSDIVSVSSDETPPYSNNQREIQEQEGENKMNIKQKLEAVSSSAVKYTLLAIGVSSTVSAASVYDDARVWFRGGYDANEDGVFASSEFADSARPKSDTAHQTVTITGSGAGYGKGAVWSSYNPFYTNTQYYASFPNGSRANSSDCTAFNLVNPLASGESWSQYSIFIRFRWDGDFAPGNNNMLYVLDTGLNWNGKRGIWFGFKYFSETDDFAPFCYAGQSSDVPSATKGIKIPVGEWQDIMITVIDRGVGSYASINLYMGSAGTVTNPGGLWPGLSDADSGRTKRVRLESTDVIKIGYAGFSGDIAEWALWPKVLSYDEMREAFGALRPGDALFRIGKEDGKSDEFAASGREQYAIDANGTWDVVPSTLDQTHDTLTINFDVSDNWHYLNQILRLVAVSGNGWIEGTVTDTVRNRTVDLKSRKLGSDHPADFFVPHDYLMSGPHTLTLKLIRGNAVTFDVIEMRGSFCLGQIDYNKSKNVQFEGTAKNSGTVVYPYDVASGYWRAMYGGVANNTFSTSGTWEGNSGASTETTFFFDMPADLVGCTNTFYVSYNNFYARIDAPDAIRGYFNDTCFYDSSTTADGKEWDWEVAYTNVPPNTLVPGRNTFRMRRTYTGSGTWWGVTRGFRIEIQNAPPRDKMGMIISVK